MSSENATLRIYNHLSIIQSHYAHKCVLTILELIEIWTNAPEVRRQNWIFVIICSTSSTQLQNETFHVVERTRTTMKCPRMKNARAKRAKGAKLFFFSVKYANLWPKTKENVCIKRKEFNSRRVDWGHQHGCRSFVLGHQNGRRDFTLKNSIHANVPLCEMVRSGALVLST